jgi:hypothetical protein
MSTSGTLSVRVELIETSEPISGRLIDASGEATPFSGWIELVSALQAAWRAGGSGDRRERR